jgi:PAS domain S-box-containing protein
VVEAHVVGRQDIEAPEFRALLEAAPDAMVIVDADGVIRLVNARAEQDFGYGREDLLGQKVEMLVPHRLRAAHAGHRARFLDDPTPRPMGSGLELFGLRRDGTEFPIEISLSPLQTAGGILISSTARDITERKRVEEHLAAAKLAAETTSRELEAFSYSVAHDLRAPLRGIDGFSQVLIEDHAGQLDEKGLHYLQRVRSLAQHMAQMIDGLLGLSRVSQAELNRQDTDLSALAAAAVGRLRSADPARDVEVVIEDGLHDVGDERLLANLLDNLLGNAWKFTAGRPDARITFNRTGEPGEATYAVQDNGAGFDMAHAAKLFGVFQRLHTAEEFEGTGVGLATVDRIVRRHGGRIWAEAAVGEGARFLFTLGGSEVR